MNVLEWMVLGGYIRHRWDRKRERQTQEVWTREAGLHSGKRKATPDRPDAEADTLLCLLAWLLASGSLDKRHGGGLILGIGI